MFKKATFALAGALGMVAAATLSTTAGAADTDAALANNITFYENKVFNPVGGGTQDAEATTTECKAVALNNGVTEAQSAKLIGTGFTVKLFSDNTCTGAVIATLDSSNEEDAGLTWLATAKYYKRF